MSRWRAMVLTFSVVKVQFLLKRKIGYSQFARQVYPAPSYMGFFSLDFTSLGRL